MHGFGVANYPLINFSFHVFGLWFYSRNHNRNKYDWYFRYLSYLLSLLASSCSIWPAQSFSGASSNLARSANSRKP